MTTDDVFADLARKGCPSHGLACVELEQPPSCCCDDEHNDQILQKAKRLRVTSTFSLDAAHIERQRDWSAKTFGPGFRRGTIDHIRKELEEIEADPLDLNEWVDVIILALDGAWRAGHAPQQILDAIQQKQAKNEGRTWPDWRTQPLDQAIEHDRTGES